MGDQGEQQEQNVGGQEQTQGVHGAGHRVGGLGWRPWMGGYGGLYGGLGWGGLGWGGLGWRGAGWPYGGLGWNGLQTAETLRRSQELTQALAGARTETVAETLRRSQEVALATNAGLWGGYPYGAWGLGGRPWGLGGLGWRHPWHLRRLTQAQDQGNEEGGEGEQEQQEQTPQQQALTLAQESLRRSRQLQESLAATRLGWGGYPYGAGLYGRWGGWNGLGWTGAWAGAALRRSRLLAGQTTTTTTNVPLTTSSSVNETLRVAAEALKRSQMGLQRHVNGLPDVQPEGEQVQQQEEAPVEEKQEQ